MRADFSFARRLFLRLGSRRARRRARCGTCARSRRGCTTGSCSTRCSSRSVLLLLLRLQLVLVIIDLHYQRHLELLLLIC